MAGHLSNRFSAAVFLLVTSVALTGGCNHPRSTPPGASEGSKGATEAPSEVSPASIGKQITIRGKFSLGGKPHPFILLDDQQEVYLAPDMSSGSFTWGSPYSEMEGKVVAATGILRFHKEPPPVSTPRPVQRSFDYFYFNLETTQLRPIDH